MHRSERPVKHSKKQWDFALTLHFASMHTSTCATLLMYHCRIPKHWVSNILLSLWTMFEQVQFFCFLFFVGAFLLKFMLKHLHFDFHTQRYAVWTLVMWETSSGQYSGNLFSTGFKYTMNVHSECSICGLCSILSYVKRDCGGIGPLWLGQHIRILSMVLTTITWVFWKLY